MRLQLFLASIYLLNCSAGKCDVFEIGTSPDGKFVVTIESNKGDEQFGIGDIQVRNKSTNEILGSSSYQQYNPIKAPASAGIASGVHASLLWTKDAQAFAITWQAGKAADSSDVFLQRGGKWVEVEIPDFWPVNRADGWQDHSRASYAASSWLKDHVLVMLFDDDLHRLKKDGTMETIPDFWVYLRLSTIGNKAHFEFLKKIPTLRDHAN